MITRISHDIIAALKSKDKFLATVLRSLKAALQNMQIEKGAPLTDEESIAVLQAQVKSRLQAIELYHKGGREDLATQEEAEITVIKRYLPTPLTKEEMQQEVQLMISELGASSMKDMGAVMKELKDKLGTRADGKILSSLVRNELS
jgi:uncharacterized protein YqeY